MRYADRLIERIDPQIRQILGADTPTDIGDVDARQYSRSYQFGQRVQDTGIGRGARRVFDALGTGARVAGRVGSIAGKTVGKAIPILEVLDLADKIDYFSGGATRRITQEAVETGDIDTILGRYELLQQERAFHTGSGLDVVGRLLGTGATAFEEDYFEREGGLRDIGSLWSGLEWAEQIPVLDPIMVAWDKIEKGIGGRVFDAITDPTGRLVAGETDVQLGQLQQLLEERQIALTRPQRERFGAALQAQRGSLTTELGGIPVYDEAQVAQRRADIESEIKRINASEDKVVRVVGGMGDSFVSGATQFRSKTARIKELEHELAGLPDVRAERLRTQIKSVDTQLATIGQVDTPITTGLRVALPTPVGKGRQFPPEPVIPEQLQARDLIPNVAPVVPLTRPEPRVVPEPVVPPIFPTLPGQLRDMPTLSVSPLTEALTGEALEVERARRMGFVPAEEQAIAETEETDTAPARRALDAEAGQWRYRFPELRVPRDW